MVSLTKKNLYKRDRGHCRVCHKGVTLEHCCGGHIVLPSQGGRWEWENMVLVHPKCITNRDVEEVLKVLPIYVPIEERGW